MCSRFAFTVSVWCPSSQVCCYFAPQQKRLTIKVKKQWRISVWFLLKSFVASRRQTLESRAWWRWSCAMLKSFEKNLCFCVWEHECVCVCVKILFASSLLNSVWVPVSSRGAPQLQPHSSSLLPSLCYMSVYALVTSNFSLNLLHLPSLPLVRTHTFTLTLTLPEDKVVWTKAKLES